MQQKCFCASIFLQNFLLANIGSKCNKDCKTHFPTRLFPNITWWPPSITTFVSKYTLPKNWSGSQSKVASSNKLKKMVTLVLCTLFISLLFSFRYLWSLAIIIIMTENGGKNKCGYLWSLVAGENLRMERPPV